MLLAPAGGVGRPGQLSAPELLTLDVVLALQERLSKVFGGSGGVREPRLLEGALHRLRSGYTNRPLVTEMAFFGNELAVGDLGGAPSPGIASLDREVGGSLLGNVGAAQVLPCPRIITARGRFQDGPREMAGQEPKDLASTSTLIRRIQQGDDEARNALIERCLPLLQRWARGRMPDLARGPADTDDLVQTSVLRTLDRLDHLQPRESGSFLAYMRQVLINAARDEARRGGRRPMHRRLGDGTGELSEVAGPSSDPDVVAAYEAALEKLSPALRDAVVLRVEFGMSFPEVAAELGMASANAARMRVSRALVELSEAMPR